MAKFVFISDTHNRHDCLNIPECDFLIHAGDLSMNGSFEEIESAVQWLNQQPAKHVVIVAGNHDRFFEEHPRDASKLLDATRIHYLENSGVVLEDVIFWGSPYTIKYGNWAFSCETGNMENHWKKIPKDVNVLITHSPAYGLFDQSFPKKSSPHLGCASLLSAIVRRAPLIHVFGHIHGGNDREETPSRKLDWVESINASIMDENYQPINGYKIREIDIG